MQGVIGTTWRSALLHTKMPRWQLASWELLWEEGGLLLSEWLLASICVCSCALTGVVPGTAPAVGAPAYYFTGALAAFCNDYNENLPNRMFWPVNSYSGTQRRHLFSSPRVSAGNLPALCPASSQTGLNMICSLFRLPNFFAVLLLPTTTTTTTMKTELENNCLKTK